MGLVERLRRSSHIHDDVADRFARHLKSGRLLDIPVGKGENARALAERGFDVTGADLSPEKAEAAGYELERADMTRPLPFATGSFDGILFSEGIEHVDAQIEVLAELSRVLRPGGVLIVTTPNLLHLEGRLGRMLTGHAYRNRSIVVETAAYWGKRDAESPGTAGTYFGHVFLIDAFQLRFYLLHVGLDVIEVDSTRYSWKSLLLAPFLFPFVWAATASILRNPRSRIPPELRRTLRRQILSGPVLFGRKLIMVARKPAG